MMKYQVTGTNNLIPRDLKIIFCDLPAYDHVTRPRDLGYHLLSPSGPYRSAIPASSFDPSSQIVPASDAQRRIVLLLQLFVLRVCL